MVWFGRNIKDYLVPNQSPPFAAVAFVHDRVRSPTIPKGVHDCIFHLSHRDSSAYALPPSHRHFSQRLSRSKKIPTLASEKRQNVHANVGQSFHRLSTFCGTRQPFSMHLCSFFLWMLTGVWQFKLQEKQHKLCCAQMCCSTGSSKKTMF